MDESTQHKKKKNKLNEKEEWQKNNWNVLEDISMLNNSHFLTLFHNFFLLRHTRKKRSETFLLKVHKGRGMCIRFQLRRSAEKLSKSPCSHTYRGHWDDKTFTFHYSHACMHTRDDDDDARSSSPAAQEKGCWHFFASWFSLFDALMRCVSPFVCMHELSPGTKGEIFYKILNWIPSCALKRHKSDFFMLY